MRDCWTNTEQAALNRASVAIKIVFRIAPPVSVAQLKPTFDTLQVLGMFIELVFETILSGLESLQVFKDRIFDIVSHDAFSRCITGA
jgi:hypothetical protein